MGKGGKSKKADKSDEKPAKSGDFEKIGGNTIENEQCTDCIRRRRRREREKTSWWERGKKRQRGEEERNSFLKLLSHTTYFIKSLRSLMRILFTLIFLWG